MHSESITHFRNEHSGARHIEEAEDETSYRDFFRNYLLPNRPCLLSTDVTARWRSRAEWVSEDGSPNFHNLRKLFGQATVPVADCKQQQYSAQPKRDMTLSDYLDYWESYRAHGHPSSDAILYLKDWHFTYDFPDYRAYTTPVYFLSDWLNEFWDTKADDDYRFVYMGPKNSWTPFHADVYRSYSWSANICGRKKWIFFPPGGEDLLKDRFGQLVYDVTSPELKNPSKFPNYCEEKDQRLEIFQEQGEIIFVPSGWHHQVYNLEDTISINHNWLNGCNVDIAWQHLQQGLSSVQREIDDCRDMDGWPQQCQVILNASAGIDYATFFDLLKVVAENRLKMLPDVKSYSTNSNVSRNELGTSQRTDRKSYSSTTINQSKLTTGREKVRGTGREVDTADVLLACVQKHDTSLVSEWVKVGNTEEDQSFTACTSSKSRPDSTCVRDDNTCVRDNNTCVRDDNTCVRDDNTCVRDDNKTESNILSESLLSRVDITTSSRSLESSSRQTHSREGNVETQEKCIDPVKSCSVCTGEGELSTEHVLFDLSRVAAVLREMLHNKEFQEIERTTLSADPDCLLTSVESVFVNADVKGASSQDSS